MTYKQTATACFDILGTDQSVTIGPAEFDWNPAEGDSDQHAVKYLKGYLLKNNLTKGHPITLRWVTCGPVKE